MTRSTLFYSALCLSVASVAFGQKYNPFKDTGIPASEFKFLLQNEVTKALTSQEEDENVDYIYNEANTQLVKIETYNNDETEESGKFVVSYTDFNYLADGRVNYTQIYRKHPGHDDDPEKYPLWAIDDRTEYSYGDDGKISEISSVHYKYTADDDADAYIETNQIEKKYTFEYNDDVQKPSIMQHWALGTPDENGVQHLEVFNEYRYTYNGDGKILKVERKFKGMPGYIVEKEYSFDEKGRCTGVVFNNLDSKPIHKEVVTYDDNDNFTHQMNYIYDQASNTWKENFKFEYEYDETELSDDAYSYKDLFFYIGDRDVYTSHNRLTKLTSYAKDASYAGQGGFIATKSTEYTYVENQAALATVEVNPEKVSVAVYPNPVVNSFSLKSDAKFSEVIVYNLSGNIVKSFPASTQNQYNVTSLKPGVYLIVLKGESKLQKSIKFIKK